MAKIYRPYHVEINRSSDFYEDIYEIVARYQAIQYQANNIGCLLTTVNVNIDGYPRIRYSKLGDYRVWDDGQHVMFKVRGRPDRTKLRDYRIYLHKFVYWYWVDESARDAHQDISHLCGNRNCARPEHLTRESHNVNMTRVTCHTYRQNQCPHNPPCIR